MIALAELMLEVFGIAGLVLAYPVHVTRQENRRREEKHDA